MTKDNAIAELADNLHFDPSKPAQRALLKAVVDVEKRKVDNDVVIAKSVQRHNQKMFIIAIGAMIVTFSFAVWVNHLNHQDSIKLRGQELVQKR